MEGQLRDMSGPISEQMAALYRRLQAFKKGLEDVLRLRKQTLLLAHNPASVNWSELLWSPRGLYAE